nr:hypothetical protein P5630_11435 [Bacillus subtilis]WGD89623.1 hypothetical protein P5665_11015 [Bacillus subtilis]
MEQQSINPYKPGPVEEWKMTPEQLAEYVKKHPIVYREDLKPSPAFTMVPDGNRITIKHKKSTEAEPRRFDMNWYFYHSTGGAKNVQPKRN